MEARRHSMLNKKKYIGFIIRIIENPITIKHRIIKLDSVTLELLGLEKKGTSPNNLLQTVINVNTREMIEVILTACRVCTE